MTICIGILASNGIVIAADAQESDTYVKRSVQKIMTWHSTSPSGTHSPAACVIAGAGDGEFVDAFIEEFLHGVRAEMTMIDFEAYAKRKMEGFYSTHVRPLLKVDRDFDFSVIVGAYFSSMTRLFKSYRTSFRHVQGVSTAIGIGQQYALRSIDEYPFSDVRRTEITAAAVIATTKDTIEGCGKYTDIVSIHNSVVVPDETHGSRLVAPPALWTRVPSNRVAQWEHSFSSVWGERQRTLYNELIEEELTRSDSQTSEDQQ